jgi:divalent metal cation (Fe/Co/Zn/Cd) transporter
MVTRAQVDAYFERVPEHVLTVLDEAYFEYVDDPDYPDGIEEYLKRAGRRVLALRTFSKIYGLAGLRVGYAVGPPDVVAAIAKVRNAFDVNQAAQEAALAAISTLPGIELRRLRMRQAAGQQFADIVIGVPPGAAVAQGHAAADAVEAAVHGALPGSDVVVHVEPQQGEAALRERALAAAQRVPRVREIHNLTVLAVGGATEVSLHLKLPGELPLDEAHEVATEVERAIVESVPEVDAVQTHLEPLAEAGEGRSVAGDRDLVERIVREETGEPPRELRFLRTDGGLLAYLTLSLDRGTSLADAHARASAVEERIRRERPEIADVVVHTEP